MSFPLLSWVCTRGGEHGRRKADISSDGRALKDFIVFYIYFCFYRLDSDKIEMS